MSFILQWGQVVYLTWRAGPSITAAQFILWAATWAADNSFHKSLILPLNLCIGRNGKCFRSGAAWQQTPTDALVGVNLAMDRCVWCYSLVFSEFEWGVRSRLLFSVICFAGWLWRPDVVAQTSVTTITASFWSESLLCLDVFNEQGHLRPFL